MGNAYGRVGKGRMGVRAGQGKGRVSVLSRRFDPRSI